MTTIAWQRTLGPEFGSARSGQNEGSGRAKLSARARSSPHEEVGQAEAWTLGGPGRTTLTACLKHEQRTTCRQAQAMAQATTTHAIHAPTQTGTRNCAIRLREGRGDLPRR